MQEEKSLLGQIIDLPVEEFKKQIVEQKVSVGVIQNIILNLSFAYNECFMRKENILQQVFKGCLNKEDEQVKTVLEGLYAEMTKIELKVTFLKERTEELKI